MAARTVKIRHDDQTRAKIKTSQIINRLTSHVLSDLELTPSQVSAGLGLLRKTLPDLQATEMKHEVSDKLSELMKAIDGRTRGIPTRG